MENQVKTNTDQKEQQLKKLSKMSLIRSLLPIAGLVIIFLLFNFLTNFRMIGNLPLVLSQVYVTMIAATGVFFIMTMGGLDFSQGSILGIASIVVCMLSKTSIPLAIVGGIVAGAAIGAINGYFYVYRKIKSFIVTICTMFLFRGFIKYLTTNAPVAGSAKLINFDSTGLKIACTVLILVIGFVLFRFTKFGTYLKAIGAGEKAAMFSGIRTDRMKFWIYFPGCPFMPRTPCRRSASRRTDSCGSPPPRRSRADRSSGLRRSAYCCRAAPPTASSYPRRTR